MLKFFSWNQLSGNNVDLTGKDVDIYRKNGNFIVTIVLISQDIIIREGQCEYSGKHSRKISLKYRLWRIIYMEIFQMLAGSQAMPICSWPSWISKDGKWIFVFDHFLSQCSKPNSNHFHMFHFNFGNQIRISSAWEIFLKIIFLHLYSLPMKFSQPLWDHIHAQFWKPNTNSLIVKTITYGPNKGNCILGLQ